MKKQFIHFIFFIIFLTFFPFSMGLAKNFSQLRGERYCEIFLAYKENANPSIAVYNTIGLNSCPDNLWKNLDVEQIKQSNQAFFVHLNGPRYWVIDGIQNSSLINTTIKDFNGLTMREAGILKLNWRAFLFNSQKPYRTHEVTRNTTWVYQAGKPIYEIITNQGNAFVMQSYSIQKIPQTQNDLLNLGKKLKLPKGWRFQSRILTKNAYLTPINQKATVIQDDFLNTYQQETPEFMQKIQSNS